MRDSLSTLLRCSWRLVVLYVLLAFISNVLVIVLVAAIENQWQPKGTWHSHAKPRWRWQTPPHWPHSNLTGISNGWFGRHRHYIAGWDSLVVQWQEEEAWGFPAPFVARRSESDRGDSKAVAGDLGTVVLFPEPPPPINVFSTVVRMNEIPLTPYWPGWAINIPLHAVAWLLIFTGWNFVVRTRLRRAGRCFHCGYNLKGLPAHTSCPECGASRTEAVKP